MKQLLEQIQRDQDQLTEVNWRQLAGGALIAANLLTGVPGNVDAKTTKPRQASVTQAEQNIDLNKLLHAIKQVESSGGKDTRVRYEPGVEKQLRKRFHKLNPNTKKAIEKYGYRALATSYGPYQLLASTVYDMGYSGDVETLKQDEVNKEWALRYIKNLRNSSKTQKVEDVISAYNAGLGRIGTNPHYINNVIGHYNKI